MTPNTSKPTRAAVYARQSVSEPEGIKRQVEACVALAVSRDYVVVETYEDDAVSGYSERRHGTAFDRMLADARAGRFDVLIVRKLDRLGRSLSALEALTAAKVNTVTTDGALDLASPSGRLVANVLTSVARAEVEVKAERRVFANADRRTKGIPTSGRVPYGLRWIATKERADRGTTQAYALDGEAANDVRAIFEQFLAGVALGSIARDLNARGRRTAPFKGYPEGAPFRPTTLRRILLNPYYAALLPLPPAGGWPAHYDQSAVTRAMCVAGDWPAIVTPEQWEAASARLAHPERKTSPGPSRKWLLSGLAVCGGHGPRDDAAIAARAAERGISDGEAALEVAAERCGELIRAGGGEAGIHSYRCRSMAHFMRRGDPLDDFVERRVVQTIASLGADLLVTRERPDVPAITAELARLEATVRQAGDDEQDGLIDRAERVRLTKRANARIGELRSKLAEGVDSTALADIVGAADVATAWRGLSLGVQRAILEQLYAIVVYSVGQGNRRNMPDAAMALTLDLVPRWG